MKIHKTAILTTIATLVLIVLLANFLAGNNLFCDYKTICRLSYKRSCWDLQNPEFDCGIIYNRLGKYWNKNSSYVSGSMANIEVTACSKEVLGVLEKQFNLTLTNETCKYYCCVTDGTCYNGVGVNNQALCIGN
jgi:hypothetical protein